jgi:hypothetical protein
MGDPYIQVSEKATQALLELSVAVLSKTRSLSAQWTSLMQMDSAISIPSIYGCAPKMGKGAWDDVVVERCLNVLLEYTTLQPDIPSRTDRWNFRSLRIYIDSTTRAPCPRDIDATFPWFDAQENLAKFHPKRWGRTRC